jgi:hypothetical protein
MGVINKLLGRLKLYSDPAVTTQTTTVIQSDTTNSSIALVPNGTGAIIASVPDGTATGGNARGSYSVDLQVFRQLNNRVSSGNYSTIIGGADNQSSGDYSLSGGRESRASAESSISIGKNNTASGVNSLVVGGNQNQASGVNSTVIGGGGNNVSGTYSVALGASNIASSGFSTISGGQSNTASTNTHATVVGGSGNTSSGQYSISGGRNSIASGNRSMAFNDGSQATGIGASAFNSSFAYGDYSTSFGTNSQAQTRSSFAIGNGSKAGYYNCFSHGADIAANGHYQYSNLVSIREASLTTAATTVLSLDGTGTTNLIIPGNNRAWKVKVEWISTVTTITGTATGITVGDMAYGEANFGFKKVSGTSVLGNFINDEEASDNAIMDTCTLSYSVGASQELALTFTGPTFTGGGSVTMRVVAKVSLVEVAY